MLYEKCLKYEMNKQRMDAIITANAAIYGSPSYSEKSAKSKQQHWRKFLDSLSWDKVTKSRRKKTIGEIRKTFGALGIKVKGQKKGDK